MWFAAIDPKHQPEIYLCQSEEEAKAKCEELFKDHHVDDAQFDGFIVMGEVKELVNVNTEYQTINELLYRKINVGD